MGGQVKPGHGVCIVGNKHHVATEFAQPDSRGGRLRMNLRERIGIDIGRKLSLEDAAAWAAAHAVRFVDVQLDTGANALGTIDERRGAALRAECERHGIHLGLHTSSAVNVAEYAPYVGDAVEQ